MYGSMYVWIMYGSKITIKNVIKKMLFSESVLKAYFVSTNRC